MGLLSLVPGTDCFAATSAPPAAPTGGLKVTQGVGLTGWICDILDNPGDADVEANVAKHVAALCADFPVYR